MSATPPPAPPPPESTPAPPPAPEPGPPPDDIAGLIDRLSRFDPADLERRLGELDEKIRDSAPVVAIREALGPIFANLDSTLKELVQRLQGTPASPPASPPAAGPPPTPAPPKPAAAPESPAGLLDKLFSTPTIGGS